MTGPEWRSDVRLLMAHPTDAAVLLRDEGGGLAVPIVTLAERVWSGEPAAVVTAVRARCDRPVAVLFAVREAVDEEAATVDTAVVCEFVPGIPGDDLPGEAADGTVSTAGAWVGVDRLDEAAGAWVGADRIDEVAAADRTLLVDALRRLDAPGRPAWEARGWLAGAGSWLRDAAAAAGYAPCGPVEQVRTWALSAVLRVPTDAGYVYLKAASRMPLFADEPAVTTALAAMFPDAVPMPLAVDPARGWLALADFGEPVGWEAPKADRVEVVRDFARLQIATVDRVAELTAAGCVDRRLDRLAALDEEWLLGRARRYLSDAECDRLRAALADLPARCAELAAYRVPDTLLHGDMHPGNVARGPHGHRFFDWTDAGIGHPFLDMFLIAQENDEEVAAAMRAAYLGEWSAYTGTDLTGPAWDAAVALIAAHHSVSYASLTAEIDPPDPDMDGATGSFLRMFTATMSHESDISVLAGSDSEPR